MTENIIQLEAKRTTEVYHGVTITYQFNPTHKRWGYQFKITQELEFDGENKSLDKVKQAAHKRIDELRGL